MLQTAAFESNEESAATRVDKSADVSAQGGSGLQVAKFRDKGKIEASLIDSITFGAKLRAAVVLAMMLFLWFNWYSYSSGRDSRWARPARWLGQLSFRISFPSLPKFSPPDS